MITKTLYTASEIEKALGVGNGYKQVLVKRGLLTPIYSGANGKRAQAYTGESVHALLAGKSGGKEVVA